MSDATASSPVSGSKAHYNKHLYSACRAAAGMVCRLMFRMKARGIENIPPRGGVLIVSNHQSFLDPLVVGVFSRRPFAFLADAYLFKNRFFGWFIRSLNAFPIKSGKGDVGAMKETIRLLQAGEVLNIFPEGTRSPDGKLQPVLAGAALAIRRAKVPVVPAIIVGAYDAYPRHKKFPKPGKIRIIYRPQMRLDHLKSEEIVATLESTFREMFAEAKAWRDAS